MASPPPQNNYISFNEFVNIIETYNLDIIKATFLMSRILYRVDVFDYLENKKSSFEENQKINFNIEVEFMKIKKAYKYLKEKYFIRPIEWIERS